MYKVFINDRSLILTDNYEDYTSDYETLFLTYASEEAFFSSVELLRTSEFLNTVVVYSEDLDALWKLFCSRYPTVEAAGGVVRNQDRVLLIYKNSHWDLPKGKMESSEDAETTAVREVKEECGIGELSVSSGLEPTYYLFSENSETKLKKTHWYIMETSEEGPFKGDEKEGISDVQWVNKETWEEKKGKSYASVVNMLHSIL